MRIKAHKPTNIVPDSFLGSGVVQKGKSFLDTFEETLSVLEQHMGIPYYAERGFILYHGSCTDLLESLSCSTPLVDLVITSPPYNIGKEYEKCLEINEYIDWCTSWMRMIYEVSKAQSTFWLNLGYLEVPDDGLCVPIPYLLWNKSPFYMIQELVWNYGAGVQTKKRLCPRNEKWLFYVKDRHNYTFHLDEIRDKNVMYPNQKKNGKLRNNPNGKNPSDVWAIPKVTSGSNRCSRERVEHPAQFPLAVVERLVKVSSNPNEVVLDPFSGSSTTGIAAHAFGRVFVGIEVEKKYCDLSITRFEKYLKYRSDRDQNKTIFDE
ncbi:MAG: site-specific DNA-methyltransferase [Gammaproteobacteria bacterium]|nr:site-specific DNA-methyltransferase [Gammaproteobacteria bacterium]MYF03060.1 site-specific DNA-methyltransferase [Gammaproteobacteria bacterium]MYI76535.1 site-specific DNA-methyltransferase [Gammaproteobacteria bacterium]